MPPSKDYTKLGQLVKTERERWHWSQAVLAKKSGIQKPGTISMLETGHKPSRETIRRICDAFTTMRAQHEQQPFRVWLASDSEWDAQPRVPPSKHPDLGDDTHNATPHLSPTPRKETRNHVWGVVMPHRKKTDLFRQICTRLNALARFESVELLGLKDADIADTPAQAHRLCNSLVKRHGVQGIFFVPFEGIPRADSHNVRLTREMKDELGVEVVLLDRDLHPSPERSKLDVIQLDNVSAGSLLLEAVLAKLSNPNPRILFLQRPMSAPSVDLRLMGINGELQRRRMEVIEFPISGDPSNVSFVRRMDLACDAIICGNDETASELCQSFDRLGVAPRPIVAGFDGLRDDISWITVRQPTDHLARAAWKLMQMRTANDGVFPPVTVLIQPAEIVDGYRL